EGTYSIEAEPTATLVFSYVGYKTQEVAVDGRTTVDVILAENAELVEEVVVVGYGTRKKSHLTGAISQVGGKDIAAIQANRVDDALAPAAETATTPAAV
ncbi:MAG: carboxypeptidase-like regulatory domain-containing protein, partial [Planctomycetota bacterium]